MEVAVMQEQEEPQQHELVQQLQFPPGYHFAPTELEIVNYLRRKIEGHELPLHVVNEVAILDWQPGSLVESYKGYGENRWFFFTIREPSSSNKEEEPNRKVRAPPGVKATWKATGSVVPILAKAEQQQGHGGSEPAGEEIKVVVGTKRVLIYHSSDAEEHGKWSMHEYILKDHAKIGQYALCSIQRKQHSDTAEDDASEEGSSSSGCSKRTKATSMDPETMTKNKKRRTNKAAQPQQQALTPVEPPLEPESKASRRTATTKRKNKASLEVERQQQQQQQEVAPVIHVQPPLTPPGQAPPRPLQQEQMTPAAYSEPFGLPGAPLHGYPSHSDGMLMLGSSAPLHEEELEGTPSLSCFQGDGYDTLGDLEFQFIMACCNPKEQTPSFTGAEVIEESHAQYQPYQDDCNVFGLHNNQHLDTEQQYFPGSSSSWMHGQHQVYQQEIGAAFGAQDQHDANAQYHEQSYNVQHEQSYNAQPYVPLALLAQQTAYCSSSDQFTESVLGDTSASGSDADLGLPDDDSFNCASFLRDDYPEDGVGTQDESSPEALQSQGEPVYDVQPSLACSISDFWGM